MLRAFLFLLLSASCFSQAHPFKIISERPKLVLVVVVDQLRSDYLPRLLPHFLPAQASSGVGGFRYLMEKGAYFPHGQFDLLQNMTAPGHATILTGAYPYQSGIPLNYWFDPQKGEPIYALQDNDHKWIDSTSTKKTLGTSPRNLLATTVGDELKNAGYPSKVVSLALKDRAAILLGGHRPDESIWFDSKGFHWTSSTYYHPTGKLPDWVKQLNANLEKEKGTTRKWEKTFKSSLVHSDNALLNLDKETTESFGIQFPHKFLIGKEKSLASPYGIEITEAAAEKAIDTFQLGKGKSTDLLAVGFSSFDFLGHEFGPNSAEMEQLTVDLDKNLAKLFRAVDKKVPGGLKNVVIVLTADHGIPPLPEWLETDRMKAARLDEDVVKDKIEAKLQEKFGEPESGKWISEVRELNFYLNPKAQGKKSNKVQLENEIKRAVLELPGILHAFTSTEIASGNFLPGALERQAKRTFFPGRSGDVVALLKPFYMAGDDKVMHMTSYKYDSSVPILFAGKHVAPGVHSNLAEVVDIAPTLSFLVGTVPPAMSEGRVLSEILH